MKTLKEQISKEQWTQIREIYREAFPKAEQKPFFLIKRLVKSKKAQVFLSAEGGMVQGFLLAIPFGDTVMVDYLAVSGKIRSKGIGSTLIREACGYYSGKTVVLLIERLRDNAENQKQRIARKNFYLKNGFTTPDIFITGRSGEMEVLSCGGIISPQEYLDLQKYSMGNWMFRLSGIQLSI